MTFPVYVYYSFTTEQEILLVLMATTFGFTLNIQTINIDRQHFDMLFLFILGKYDLTFHLNFLLKGKIA